ncbi:polysaccharide biosynthesis tyrosine autokinase [Jiella avicenniae]|uniref:non-specific protein-tyrosine kinase n=1 Tax=Jiella avicenniae TaxID=2907202 RepID=A0A9X1P4H3_9HYPH|nr:polysaccharide biosynthesis tyrosine autokinase [Jiella avicenniae]MCE7030857.1 polysaccharide biosynthesis tyrosine autokinase [Jiella avicenniae]
MLHFPDTRLGAQDRHFDDEETSVEFLDFDRLLAAARRQVWIVLAGAAIGLVLGLAYVVSAVPLYTATTDLLIDKGQSKLVDELSAASGVFQDEAEMLSQVELLKSRQIAEAVVTQLNLTQNERFMAGNPSLIGSAIGAVKATVSDVVGSLIPNLDASDVAGQDDAVEDAITILQNNLSVERVGRTYVLRLGYTSSDPSMAVRIARTYGDAYLDDQLQAKYDATKRASGWLQDRIAELKQQSFAADLAVQKFRNDNGLISSGNQLVSEQQLNEITTQLITAQAETASTKARLDQIRGIINAGRTDAVVGDALVSTTINTLREKYLDAARREAEISKKLGPNHVQAVRLRNEMNDYQNLIFGELRRIAESYENAYKVALSRQNSLQASLDGVVGVNAEKNTVQVKLRELERESETFKSLYDNFLQRYQQTVQQQSFPITDARIITPPSYPEHPSYPRKPLILALFLVLGLASSSGIAAFREYRDRFFRTGDQVRSELQAEFLGFMPAVSPVDGKSQDATLMPGEGLWPATSMAAYVRHHPLSAFAETLRNVKVAADMALPDLDAKVIGVVSCIPGEGKSTTSANLGILLAMQGAKTLLIDGDLRNPGLSRGLAGKPDTGLIEAVLGNASQEAVLRHDQSRQLTVLPTVLRQRVSHTSELLASPSMAAILAGYRKQFDYIVVDLPPVGPVVDAKAFANRVDAFVFVVEWGRTSRQLVRSMMANNPVFHEKCLGVILNKSDESKMRLYRSYGSAEYYASRYGSYYHH